MGKKETAADLVAQAQRDYRAGAAQRDPVAVATGTAAAAKHLVEARNAKAGSGR
ncbi:hypothetical protein ACFY0G_17480 [Streptomyces sp. NPDC001552]|uniref:hypothetical protein n=1 Tax=Streptomyces sp. NPDC001552 TaxID=3364587 RepID=UPI003699EE16